MFIKQISVFVENKSGRLADITGIIADNNIDLRAVSLADTSDFGILRVIVNDPDKAERVLKEAGLAVALTDVIAVGLNDKPGAFAKVVKMLSDGNANVEYMYAFTGNHEGTAYVIMKMDNPQKGLALLKQHNIKIITCDDVYTM